MDAFALLQSYMDVVAAAVMQGDWPTYEAHVSLPFHLVTQTADMTVTTQTELRAGFDDFQETLKLQRITDLIQLVETASRLDHDRISGQYMTHLLASGHRVIAPYRSSITLRLIGNQWRAVSIANSSAIARWPITVPKLAEAQDQISDAQLLRKDQK